jgi:outer membrane protein assembly factor BamB
MRALAVCLMLLAGSGAVNAADWPRFRGPNGSGVAETTGLPADLGPAKNVVWKTPLPPGYSSPVLSGDRIFLTAYEGETLLTLALDQATGKVLWRREAPRSRLEPLDRRNGPASPSAVADGLTVTVFFGDFGLISYDKGGRERWRVPLGPFNNAYGMGASPIRVDDLVVLVCDQGTDSFIAAFDAASGRPRWKTARPDALSGHATPALFRPPAGPVQILAPGSFRMDAYSAKTGESLWWVGGLPSEMKAGPVLGDDTVYVSGYSSPMNEPGQHPTLPGYDEVMAARDANKDGRLTKDEVDENTREIFVYVDLDRDGSLSRPEWAKNILGMAAENGLLAFRLGGKGESTREGLKWTHRRSIPQLPTTLLYEGVLYMINDGGILTTLDPATGTVLKQGRLRAAVDQYYASPVAADGKVFLASRTGILSVLKAGGDQEVLAVNDFDEEIVATPAIADHRIYVRTKGALYCFGAKAAPATTGGRP